MNTAKMFLGFLVAVAVMPALAGGVKVENAWVRATAPGQEVAGAFMDLTADADMTLVAAESALSKAVELHTMAMENGVMIMRSVKSIPLPKGKTVSLKPGGLHVMLIDLNGQIREGDRPKVTLVIQDAAGKESKLNVEVVARKSGGMRQHQH